jgi:hypothetical protein
VIKLWMSFVVTYENFSYVMDKIDGMTTSGSTLITRRGLTPGTLKVGLAEDRDSGKEGRANCWPRICILLIMSLWETCYFPMGYFMLAFTGPE